MAVLGLSSSLEQAKHLQLLVLEKPRSAFALTDAVYAFERSH